MAFWGVEVLPGKAFTTKPLFTLKVTKATIAAGASDHARSVVQVKAEEKLFACASLKLDSQDSADLDLIFEEQEDVTFVVTGKNSVHLTGYYMPDDDEEGFDGEEYPFGDSDEEIGSDNQIGSESEGEEEIPAPVAAGGNKRKANGAPQQPHQDQPKKQKQEQPQAPKGQQQQQQQQGGKPKTPEGHKGGQQQQQQGGKPKTPEGQKGGQQQQKSQPNTPKPQGGQQGGKPQEGEHKDLGDKLKAVILKSGSGSAHALSGQKVVVKYVGKLDSGKVFDSAGSFPFKLGAGEVIPGWDRGVAGMTIGEQRRLIVPPHLAYGREGIKGAIPPNATLTFDVELVKIGGR